MVERPQVTLPVTNSSKQLNIPDISDISNRK